MKDTLGLKKLKRNGIIQYAMHWTGFNVNEISDFTGVKGIKKNTLFTLKPNVYISPNDWIIQCGETGQFSRLTNKNKKKKYTEV